MENHDITVGRCTMPYDAGEDGWALPGGGFVYNQERAHELAVRLDRYMRVTPHRYSVRAAQAATFANGGIRK